MPRILDRYLLREILLPFFLWLLLLTFVLMMPPILQNAEQLIAKGVAWSIIVRVLLTLVPQALGITIPMALLLGILIGLGRLSADREFVALQACGVSVFRVLQPIAVLAAAACAATAYVMIVALPNANQTFREITFNAIATKAESDIKPRVFFDQFPNRVLYVRDVQPDGWRDVFLADDTHAGQTTAYFARAGRLLVDRAKRRVELVLERGTRHTTFSSKPDEYEGSSFDQLVLNMDAETVFPRTQVIKGDNEMTIAELRAQAAQNAAAGAPAGSQYFTIQQKFSIPAACFVLALIGVALGVSNRKDGKLAGFVVGVAVIFIYYVMLWTSRAGAFSGRLPPRVAPWIANIVLGVVGIALVMWRAGSADQPIRISLPAFRRSRATTSPASGSTAGGGAPRRKVVLVIRIPHIDWPRPTLLDLYVSQQYVRIFLLSFVALVGLFYISTFIDLADKLFRGTATSAMLLRYFYWETPQYVYYIIPLAGLVATLVTMGLLTKNSELIVMRACGISLYRSSLPILVFAIVFSGVLFEMQEHVLAHSNRQAQRLIAMIKGWPVQNFGVLDRRWLVTDSGDIYHYEFFNPAVNQFNSLSVFHIDPAAWRLDSLTFAKNVTLTKSADVGREPSVTWTPTRGWSRQFRTTTTTRNSVQTIVNYEAFAESPVSLPPPKFFNTPEPDADRMTYGELKRYVAELQSSGYSVIGYMVQLQRKVAFPFVTVIMTLLALPFAVTTGRRGALYGIGIGIVMAITYWIALSVFAALGSGGAMSPALAAWAPNILFSAAAAVMLLTVRT